MLCSILLLLLPHPFNGLLSQTTWVSRYQKGKISLDLNKARYNGVLGCSGISWTICKQSAPHSRQITTPTPHYFVLRCFNTVCWVPGRTSGLQKLSEWRAAKTFTKWEVYGKPVREYICQGMHTRTDRWTGRKHNSSIKWAAEAWCNIILT